MVKDVWLLLLQKEVREIEMTKSEILEDER